MNRHERPTGGEDRPHLVHIVTAPMAVPAMLEGQLRRFRQAGFRVTVVSSPGAALCRAAERDGVEARAVPMARHIAPLADLGSLWRLWRLLRELRPAICHVGTPKAGLLGGLAGWAAGVPHRFYTLHGLRLETATGAAGCLLFAAEWLACRMAHRVISVSESLRQRAVTLGVVAAEKTAVIGEGSAKGMDITPFLPGARKEITVRHLRGRLGIDPEHKVVGFVGRVTRDKGITELIDAFGILRRKRPGLTLLLVGEFERPREIPRRIRRAIEDDPAIIHTGFVARPTPYYGLMDVVVLPSYREGFPTVALEAAAAGKPLVAARATGSIDAVIDGETGILVPPRDAATLATAVESLLADTETASRIGRAARERVRARFSPERLARGYVSLYRNALAGAQGVSARSCPRREPYRGKRASDIVAALGGLLFLSPLLLLIAAAVRARMGSPILFCRKRAGWGGEVFELLKFRTMAPGDGPDGERLTRLGRWLRASSLDELPQLWNVLTGEMSLIGPRPLLADYLALYSDTQMRRHEVRPGLTGWAQVRGRNALSWDQKFAFDEWYAENVSPALDFKIAWLTVAAVVARQGIARAGEATMPRFEGGPAKAVS